MIPVHIIKNDIVIRNIERNELEQVVNCINEINDNFMQLGRVSCIDYDEINQRYLESLMNSMEFFCGIFINDSLIGIIKGRIENKSEKEIYILTYLLFEKYRNKGLGSDILKYFEEYFLKHYSINKFCILLMDNNVTGKSFWLNNGYSFSRNMLISTEDDHNKMYILDKRLNI